VAADPGNSAEQHDRQDRDTPDDHLDSARIFPVGPVGRLRVATPEPPGHSNRRDHRRDDDRKHDRGGIDEKLLFLRGDRADGVEDPAIAGAQGKECGDCGQRPQCARTNAVASHAVVARK
jgi:hypothetical protein